MTTSPSGPSVRTTGHSPSPQRSLVWAVLAVAFFLRMFQYLLNRSLWMDEAYLSLNIIHRSFAELWQPLDNHQGAPIGFLLLEKSVVSLLGPSEYALRLLPLLAGIAAICLFYLLATKTIEVAAIPIALVLFAMSPALIYYSSEVKQYSIDVVTALLICYLTIEGSRSVWRPMPVAIVGLVGAVAVWFSHPAVFVLAGTGVTISVAAMVRKDWSTLARAGVAFLMWAVSWVICYLVVLRQLARDNILLDYWKTNFMPFPPRSATDLKWFVDSFFGFFSSSAGLTFVGLAGLVFVIGCLSMGSKNREMLFLLLSPAIAALFASALQKYPFGGRLTLFLVPAALLLMAEGARAIHSAHPSRLPIEALLIGLLFLDPGMYILHHFGKPHIEVVWPGVMIAEEIRPVMTYLRTHEQPGDLVYVFSESEPAFDYYQERYGFPQNNVRIGTASGDDPQRYASDLNQLRGKRAWILLSHIHGAGASESKHVKFYLDMMGKRIDVFARAGAESWLYDLSSADLALCKPGQSDSP